MHRLLPVVLCVAALSVAGCNEDGTVKVNSLKFNGVSSVDVSLLKNALATREQSRIPVLGIRLPWAKARGFFDRGRFDADLKRIEAFYADRGFPDARVTSFDVKLNDRQDAVDVTLLVAEGAPVVVTAVNFVGFDSTIPAEHYATLTKQQTLILGKPRARQDVLTVHELAVNELRDHGYPYAKVGTDENDGADGKQAVITFTAEPGVVAHFGTVEVAGNRSVGEDVIRRQLTIESGEVYRRSAVQDSQRRLYAMELFQFVNIEALNPEAQNPEVPTRVTVAEGKHQRFNGGIGYGTEEKGRVDAEYRHVNFLGGARSAGVHGRYSSLDRGVRFDFNQPYFFDARNSFGADGQQWYSKTPAYQSNVTGARITMTRRPTSRTSLALSLASERTDSLVYPEVLADPSNVDELIALGLDPVTGSQEGTLSAVGLDLQHSTADNLLNATRGYQVALHAEEAGRLLPGTFNYFAVAVDVRHYLPATKSVVIANRVQFGNIAAAGNDPTQVPFSKKYFLGGATSLRGWGRYEVSPLLSGSGIPIGGNTLLALSTEVRATLKGNIGGVLFADAGNVWATHSSTDEEQESFSLADLRYDVGAGLRYHTPIGPIRLDLGYQLNPVPGLLIDGREQLRQWRLHFSIGQAF